MLGRVRLTMTVTNFAVVAVVVIALLLSAFFVAQRVITRNADRDLVGVAESIQRIARNPFSGPVGGFQGLRPDPRQILDFRQFARRDPPLEFAVFDADGEITTAIEDLPSPLPLTSDVQKALDGNQQISTVNGESGSMRVVTRPVLDQDGAIIAVLQIAESRQAQDQIVTTLRNVLLVVGAAGLLFAGGAGYLLTGRTMRPVDLAFERQKSFVADAAHELRTPLAIISANAEALEMASADMPGADKDLLTTIRTESTYLAALLSKLLEMAKLDFDEERAGHDVVDLTAVVTEACEAVAPLAKASGISLEWSETTEPLEVSGDRVLIRLIVLSLLDNAIKYGQEGCEIDVNLEGSSTQASVRIKDNGPGISPEHLERVFDRFYRVDRARSRKTGGAGLGLAIAKRAAEVIDGQLSLTSDEQTGTVATVRFQRNSGQV